MHHVCGGKKWFDGTLTIDFLHLCDCFGKNPGTESDIHKGKKENGYVSSGFFFGLTYNSYKGILCFTEHIKLIKKISMIEQWSIYLFKLFLKMVKHKI